MRHFADLLLNKNNSKDNDQVPFIQRRRGIEIKSAREINLMKKSSRIVATVLREINELIKVFIFVSFPIVIDRFKIAKAIMAILKIFTYYYYLFR